MHTLGNPSSHCSRKEIIQGPRPAPLKVSKDSHKIRKPPLPPQPAPHLHAEPSRPVIIYQDSPKTIHVKAEDFKSLVQRLTGRNSTCTSSSSSYSSLAFQENTGGASPAGRLASFEQAKVPSGIITQGFQDYGMGLMEGLEIESGLLQRTAPFPAGILSPNPMSLPPIPPNYSFPLPDSIPGINSNRINYLDNGLDIINPTPSTLFSQQISMPSPNTLDRPSQHDWFEP